ncbi:type III pantothenate kinase [Motilibacter peucedani]|uniref:Type III pantothenate kinase n=1 Tax=Motilibacter peucedani TaxID=598650 RepID=A0A420XTP6_9ACTN|nr:glycosyltransferase [Motilibacter peucedani]RKS80216.1 type III pantothenate kinase [Motilibacter peucedani]
MRIAMVSEHASPLAVLGGEDAGGQNVHVAALSTALARRGHDVRVYTRRDAADLPERVPFAPGVEVVHVPAGPPEALGKDALLPYMPEMGAWLARGWARERPDVVHAHFWMSGVAAEAALRTLPAAPPLAQTFHALGVVKRRHQGSRDTSPAERAAHESRLLAGVDAVVATCRDEISELLALGAVADRLHVVPCGVDTAVFHPAGPAEDAWSAEARTRLLCLGRLVERKGVHTAVEALALLPGAELVVAGGPAAEALDYDPDVQRLRAHAAALGVADRVRFVGRVDPARAARLLRGAHLLLAVPAYEPFGIVPIEAMACGTPVVASGVGGMLDTVLPGVTGLHVPPGDPSAVAAAVSRALADAGWLHAAGRAGARRVRDHYTWDSVAAATEAVYARLLEPARPTATSQGRPPVTTYTSLSDHLDDLARGLTDLAAQSDEIDRWGEQLASCLDGGRLLVAGNGGSAAEAQHLTAELVGRFEGERRPLSAIVLHGDTSATTAISNDYGADEVFARQVEAHGRPGDVLLLLSTSGRSSNLLAAATRARACGVAVWALTGPRPNPLAELADRVLSVDAASVSSIQEGHLVAVHALCAAVERSLARLDEVDLREVADGVLPPAGARR